MDNNLLATITPAGVVTGILPGADNAIYTYTNVCGTVTSTFEVTVRQPGACDTVTGTPTVNSGITELKAYPNPNDGAFTLNLVSASDEQVNVVITNVVGEVVKTYTTTTNKELNITIGNTPGIYVVSAVAGGNKYLAKVVVR